MKCRRCKSPAVLDIRRHNAAFCRDCFLHHCREQVRRTIEHFRMIAAGERVLMAVSGGKDSLGLWDILLDLGYEVDGLYLGLGIPGAGEGAEHYSETSGRFARDYATARGARLIEIDLPTDLGFDIPGAAAATRRVPCGACGMSKRHLFNKAALDGGYDVVATGHNLDDEAAVLFGNVLRWDASYLGRQYPVLPGGDGFVRKVKPLVRVSEREMAAYCVLTGIDYIIEECPMAVGNKHMAYKEALNALELKSPGAKASFLFGFLERGHERFAGDADDEKGELVPCADCGSPTTQAVSSGSTADDIAGPDRCAFCRMSEKARARGPGTVEPRAV